MTGHAVVLTLRASSSCRSSLQTADKQRSRRSRRGAFSFEYDGKMPGIHGSFRWLVERQGCSASNRKLEAHA